MQEDQLVECRIDHYQTLEKVQVSVFAKKVNKEKSTVQFEEYEVKRLSLFVVEIVADVCIGQAGLVLT